MLVNYFSKYELTMKNTSKAFTIVCLIFTNILLK